MSRPVRDKCYLVVDQDGRELLHIRAPKKPSMRTAKALVKLFEAARAAYVSKKHMDPAGTDCPTSARPERSEDGRGSND